MGKICHHTNENRGDKAELLLSGPVLGTGESNYFGPGYYFWDNNIPQAEWWGRKQYGGNYYVFEGDLEIDKNRMFDTTDRDDIEFLKSIVGKFIGQEVDLKNYFLGAVITMLLDEQNKTGKSMFPYLYAKAVDDNAKKNPTYNPTMGFTTRTNSAFSLNPVGIICVFKKENVILSSYSLIRERGTPIKKL